MYKNLLKKATTNQELSEEEIFGLINAINRDEVSDLQIAGFQVALLMKGSSLKEITSLAKAMRANCIPLRPRLQEELMDTCGTGGGLSTFNISTATAIVAASGSSSHTFEDVLLEPEIRHDLPVLVAPRGDENRHGHAEGRDHRVEAGGDDEIAAAMLPRWICISAFWKKKILINCTKVSILSCSDFIVVKPSSQDRPLARS